MKYKMVVSDFDDTLVGDDLVIKPDLVETIREYERRGGKFFICTGRMFASIRRIALEAGLKGELSSTQGGLIADIETGEHLQENVYDMDTLVWLLEELENRNAYIQIYDTFDNILSNGFNKYSKLYQTFCKEEIKKQDIKLSKLVQEKNLKIYKILVMDTEEYIADLYKNIKDKNSDKITYSISKPFIFEAVMSNASKANSIDYWSKKYGIDKSDIIAVGDSLNDYPMLLNVGMPVAVENAVDEVKKIARFTTKSNKENGVKYMIEELCLKDE